MNTETIEVPEEFVILCRDWHDGQWSAFYSVASTGKIAYNQMFQLYSEIEPLYAKDSGEIEAYYCMRRFQNWCNRYLTDDYFELLEATV